MREHVVALDETWQAVIALLGALPPDDWARPTPCAEWSVHDVAAHLGALESWFQGMPQPDQPPSPTEGIDAWTDVGVRARRDWSPEQIVEEIRAASAAQLDHLRSLDDEGWQSARMGPIGETTEAGLVDLRLMDVYVHLLDLRHAVSRPLDPADEPHAAELNTARTVRLSGWGAVKLAGLDDGTRVRFALSGPGGTDQDLLVDGGRASFVEAAGEAGGTIRGTGLAYTLTVCGRPGPAAAAGGVSAEGAPAEALLRAYRFFG